MTTKVINASRTPDDFAQTGKAPAITSAATCATTG